MNKILFIISYLILGTSGIEAQNIVLNPSMEEYDSIGTPVILPGYECDTFIRTPQHWKSPNSGSPDYIVGLSDTCYYTIWPYTCCVPRNIRGWQWPKEGDAYYFLGTFQYYDFYDTTRQEESLKGELISELEAGKTYCLSFYLSQADVFNLTMDQIGVFFSKTDYYTPFSTIDSIPQLVIHFGEFFTDTSNWVLFNAKYTASGGEKFITFGTFEAQKPYSFSFIQPIDSCIYPPYWGTGSGIFIDMVSLYDCTGFYYEAEAGENRSLCKGEETMLGWDENTARTFKWCVVSGDSASLTNDSLPRPTVSPQQTTVYALYVVDEYVQEHFDTVTVEVIDCENPIYLPNIFSPNNDGNNDVYYVRSSYVQELKAMRIYDRWGEEVFNCSCFDYAQHDNCCGWDGKYHGQDAPTGVYAVFVEALLINGETVTKNGNVTLVR